MPLRADLRLLAILLGVTGCATTPVSAPAGRAPRAGAVTDTPVRIGQPYAVGGHSYVPVDDHGYDEVGVASLYGDRQDGRTASGEPYRGDAITAAHPTLPLPSYVEVTALDSGRTILVRINDRGPFARGRIIDLSRGAAALLGVRDGVFRVRVRRAFPPEADRAALRAGKAAAPRLAATGQLLAALNAKLDGTLGRSLRPLPKLAAASKPPMAGQDTSPDPSSVAAPETLDPQPPPPPPPRKPRPKPQPARPAAMGAGLYIQLGAFADRAHAEMLARSAGGSASSAGRVWRVRLGPFADRAAAMDALARARARGYHDAALVRDPATP